MRYLLAGGGTGGHIIPAINIAKMLGRFDTGAEFLFIGVKNRIEAEIVPTEGYKIEFIEAQPWEKSFKSLGTLIRGTKQVCRIISEFKPDAAIATGGFVSAPLILASAWKKIPLFIQEQNSLPGLATKLGSLFATKVFLGFESAQKKLWRKKKAIPSGNPVLTDPPKLNKEQLCYKWKLNPMKPIILILGGSQGAVAINETMKKMIEQRGIPCGAQVIWQTGKKQYEQISQWAADRENIVVKDFIHPISDAYSCADLAVCRAGALTLAELAASALPAIVIPYPYASQNHQEKNALEYQKNGAVIMISQSDLIADLAFSTISGVLNSPETLKSMSEAMKKIAKPDGALNIAKTIIKILSGGNV